MARNLQMDIAKLHPDVVRYLTTRWRRVVFAILTGVIMAFGQAPFSVPYGLLIALPALGWMFLNQTSKAAGFLTGWLAGGGYFAASMFWIVDPFLVEPEIFGWMAPFALIFLSAGLALFWGAGFWLASFASGRPFFRLLALAVSWTVLEFLRAHIFTGFPWGLLAYVWAETPLFQLLAFVGPHGLGLITLLLGFVPLVASRNLWIGGAYTVVATTAIWLAAEFRIPDTIQSTSTIVRVIQPNAPQNLKWRRDMVPVFFERMLKQTRAAAPIRPDVVIWPETSIPFMLGDNTAALEIISQAAGPDTQLIAGIRRVQDNRLYNSMIYLDQAGGILAVYDKHHLVPFGEYIPFAGILSRFGIRGLAAEDGAGFSAGSGVRIIRAKGLPDFLPLICYEAIFPGLAQLGNERPGWLLHLTNDAWFGSYSGPFQHLVQIRARAIEQGLPVARSANTGVSAIIDPFGQIVGRIPLNEAGYLDANLPAPLPATLYSRWSEFLWAGIALILAVIVALENLRFRRKSTLDK